MIAPQAGILALASTLVALPAVGAPLPAGWPYQNTLELGVDNEETASAIRSWGKLALRYAYITTGWRTWNSPDGQYVTDLVSSAANTAMTPAITLYEILTVAGSPTLPENRQDLANLASASAMRTYFADYKVLVRKAAGFPNTKVVLHVEPDLWGYVQQKATADDAANIPAAVASTGLSELSGLPNTAAGFAQALVKLRDLYAPNVMLGYHFNTWGTNTDIFGATSSNVDGLAARSTTFYNSLKANFDLVFAEVSDRDAGYDGKWWSDANFSVDASWIGGVSQGTGKRVVLWQVPLGNRASRSENNTARHYRGFAVEALLGDSARSKLTAYRDAGVVAVLFGPGASDQTHYTDYAADGVTNDGSSGSTATVADDDGGYFRQQVKAYYAAGAVPLSAATAPAFASRASASPATPPVGSSTSVSASVTNTGGAASGIIVQILVTDPSGAQACKKDTTGQTFAAGETKTGYACTFNPASAGTYRVSVGTFSSDWSVNYSWETPLALSAGP
jgi:hypothetical protein